MTAPAVRGPHDVPALRLYLLDRWRAGGTLERVAQAMRQGLDPVNRQVAWHERQESEWQRGHLADAKLWWVSADMVDEISHVASQLPDDVRPVDVPGLTVGDGYPQALRGLVVLEKPMMGHDAFSGLEVVVNGFVYGGTLLPPVRWQLEDGAGPYGPRQAVGIGSYNLVDFGAGVGGTTAVGGAAVMARMDLEDGRGGEGVIHLGEDNYALTYQDWMPLGRSDWPLHDPLLEKIVPNVDDESHASMMEDRRWLAALFLVANDRLVADVTPVRPAQKHQRRPSERKGLGTNVHVVYLRQPERRTGPTGPQGGRRSPRTHVVRSHPRWQAWGPEKTLRKLILVPRHTRGSGEQLPPGGTVTAVVR